MKNKKIALVSLGTAAGTLMLFSFATLAFAQGGTASTKLATKTKVNQSSLVEKSNKEIDKRVSDLTDLQSRISVMKNMSSSQVSTLTASLESQKTELSNLKSKIASDTDMKSLTADAKSITANNRTYALVLPKARILIAADRATTLTDMLTSLGVKLQARISEVQATGKDVTALTAALVDFNAKLADATSLSASIPAGISNLVPDQGNKTVAASNETALKTARKNLTLIDKDLKAARADMKIIMGGVKGVGPSAGENKQESETETHATTTGEVNQ
ncbi:MAG: hypothetical protein WCO65_00745 [bacterium]